MLKGQNQQVGDNLRNVKITNMDATTSTSKDNKTSEDPNPNLFEAKTNGQHAQQTDNNKVQKKFDLPPEYDETDSRWTLKYREPAPGLVELIKHSGIYVNAEKLAECEKWAMDCNTFARMLLTEIFTTNALRTCSWTSESNNPSDIRSGLARPGLDEHAKDIMQKYVVKYGQIHNWNGTDLQCMMKGIRQILIEMRRVRRKEKEEEEEIHKSQIDLPPEYDKNNSRWTLKYREYAPGLVELIEDSCVYVEASQLAKCMSSTDSFTLARMLLKEIFTKSALSVCSWNSPLSKDSDSKNTSVRPELDKNAMATLMKFLTQYEMENNWMVSEKKFIEKSIRQKLELLRRVAKKNKDPDEWLRKNVHVDYETDSRWTLKYREPASGLVELIEHTGVYVNANNLADYMKSSKDSQTLAQMLLTEVFTEDALRECILSEKNLDLYNFPRRGGWCSTYLLTPTPRCELDTYAEIVILNFVDEYALEKGWRVLCFKNIRKSMLDKLIEIREEHINKEKESRQAVFHDSLEHSRTPVADERQSRTNTIGPRNPIWTSFYMREYNLR